MLLLLSGLICIDVTGNKIIPFVPFCGRGRHGRGRGRARDTLDELQRALEDY